MEQNLQPQTTLDESVFTKLAQTIHDNEELKTRFTDIVMGTKSQQKSEQETFLPQSSTQHANNAQKQQREGFSPSSTQSVKPLYLTPNGQILGQKTPAPLPQTTHSGNSHMGQQGSQLGYNPHTTTKQAANSAQQVFDIVEKLDPNYFCAFPVREKLRNYLLEHCSHLPQADLFDIIELAKSLETTAIEAFKAANNHADNLQASNKRATQRLCVDSNKNSRSEINTPQTFTRAQLETMSFDDYMKNKSAILDQMRKGPIK